MLVKGDNGHLRVAYRVMPRPAAMICWYRKGTAMTKLTKQLFTRIWVTEAITAIGHGPHIHAKAPRDQALHNRESI